MSKDIKKQLVVLFVMTGLLMVLFSLGLLIAGNSKKETVLTKAAETLPVGETTEELVGRNTEYVMEVHDLDSDKVTVRQKSLPVELIGLSREDLLNYISNHKEQFQEKGEEIRNISMISFNGDELVLRKDVTESVAISETVRKSEEEPVYHYYLMLEDGVLVVYKKDKTTIFLETGIEVENLDEDERARLNQGIGITNISELYRYLEGYTS